MGLFDKATSNVKYTPQQPTTEVAEQQATSPLPPTDNPPQEVNFTQPTEQVEPQRTDEQKQLDSLYDTSKDDFISQMNQRYGILPSVGQNRLNYKQLSEQMEKDGLTTPQMREVQQQWIKSVEAYRDSLPDGNRKEELTKQIDTIKSAPMTYKEDTLKNKAKEVWRNTTPAVEAQVEHIYNAASQYVPLLGMMSDREILEKYDPEFLKKVDEAGGINFISNIGKGAKINVNEDGWGVGGMLTSGATKEQQDLGKELLAKLDNYRATETLQREDKEGEEVILPNGKKEKMSNRQAAMYYAQHGSSVAGRDEWHKEWDKNPLRAVSSLSGVGNMFADMLGSTISNAPTMVAGAAASFFNPALGLAIVNSGNITQQEFDSVNEAVSDEYKKLYGKDADVTKLSADEYAKFVQDLAKKGVVSKASAEGFLTGSLMTAAESITGGLVGKLGGKAIAAMTPKELANTLGKKLSNIAYGSVGLGLKVSDEGLQEVASTVVENARKGKPLDDGLTQSFLMGTFSIENLVQHGIRGAGKARELASKGKEQATDQSENAEAQQPENVAENTAEPTTDNAQSPVSATNKTESSQTSSPSISITEDKAKLLSEYERIINNADEDGNLSDEDAKLAKQIEDQFYKEDGTNTLQSDLNAWVKNGRQATTQDNTNEHRADNRDGTANADGETVWQGLDVTNGSGAERSSETSEQVSPTQTETTTEGNSQSNTQPTSDSTGQPHDLTQESNSTGIDGRTSETDTVRGEQGELGQDGSKQGGEPTQATSETSTDSGVQQRSQSDSVGETLGDKEVDNLYQEALSDRNAYRDTDVDNIDDAIRQSEANLARYIDEGDNQNVEYEDNYLRQAYARKEQLTGENQLDNYKRRRNELGVTNVEDLQANKRKQRIDERNQQRERQVADKEVSDLGDAIYQAYKKAISSPLAKDLPQQRERLRSMLEEHNERSDKEIDVDRYMRKFDERIKNDTTLAGRTITNIERKAEEIEAELNELIDELANISKNAKGKAVDSYNEMKSKIRKLIKRVREFFSEAKGKISNSFIKKFNELKLLADNLLDDISNFKPGHKLLTAKAWSNKTSKSAKKLRDVTNDTLKLMQDKNNEDVDADDLFGNLRSPKPGKKGSVIDVAPNKASQIKEATSRLRKNVVERSGLPRVDLSEENQQDRKVNSYGDQTNKPVDVSTSVRHKQQSSVSNERTETSSPSDTSTPTKSADKTSVTKSERKGSGEETLTPSERRAYPSFMTDEEIIASKNRLNEFVKEAKKTAHTRAFLASDKSTFKTKAEMVEAMQKAMSEHLEDAELNAELFKHASYLIDKQKGRKGWGKNSAELALPRGAKMSLTNVIGSAEKAHRQEVENAIKKEEPKENTVANFNKENRINSAIDNAVASEEEMVKPYLKEFKTGDLRSNQKRASELLKDNPKDADEIKEAFFDRTPNARPASWGVVERGYIRFDVRNPNHKSFKGTRVGLLGFDFDGNAVYGTEEMAFDDIKKSDTAEDITTITLAQQPKDTRETTDKAVENVIRTNPELEQDMRDVVEEFAKENDILEEDGSPVQGTNENIAWASNNSDFMSWLEKGSKALHAMFKKVQNVLAGVIAVVAVGAMTVPNDAMAHTGYSVYESGPKIENVSQQASDTINWVVKQKDHNGKAFVVADKAQGKILIVDTDGKVLDSQNAIFGKNKGDSTAFGNTPSGRFQLHKTETKNLSDIDKRVFGDSVLDLTDKETGRKVTNEKGQVVAMHRVVNTKQRHAALNSATANDNYLSHGCINVPTAFYNSANSKLDGAMVYVLNQDGSSNMSDAKGKTKSDVSYTNNEQSQSSNTSNTAKKTGVKSSNLKLDNHTGLNVAKKSSLKFSVKAKDITNVTGSVSVDKLRKALDHALGDLANNVNFITAKDYGNTQGFDKIRNAGVEGFYDPINKQVYIVADNIEAQNGLSAEERMAWVAWHELVHNGLDVKHGDELGNILYKVQGNNFISQLAEAIMQDRRDNQLTEIGYDKATEEALAELGAAIKTGKVKALASRYKVELPLEYQGGLKAIIGKHLVSLRQLIGKVLGKKVFTTKQVERLLEDALKEVKPDEATKAFAEKALADINDPESAFTKSVMFSVADKAKNFVKDVSHVISGGDISRTGSTPARDGTKAAKERTTRQGFISRLWTGIQDSQQVIIDLDPEGNGGRLSNAVATFSNKAAQMGRRYRSRIKNLEMKFNKFAAENKDLFPNRRDRRQIDHIVQDVTSSLRTITGGNEQIRKRVENTIFGEDIYDSNGNFVKHIPGLADRVQEYSEYVANAKAQGLAPSSYITARLNEYTKLLDDQIAIQNTFDKSDATIIQRSNAVNDTSRKNWRGHDGFTTAEAEQKLRDLKAKGFIDFDVDNLTKVPYQVKRFIKGVNGQPDTFTVETHYRYETKDVKALAKGRIMPLVDEYVTLSQDMYQEAVNLVGKDIMGDAPSEEWQVGTMGKVRNAYTTQAKDANGNVIDGVYDVSQNSNIDNIISLRQAAEYQSRLNGRAFNGGTALENLTWHVELMSKQAASKNIGKVLYDLWQDPKTSHLVKVYRRNDKDYSSQNGILITRNKVVGGRVVRDANGNPVQEVIKVAFADEEANRALFGDNIAREEITNGNLIARALFGMLSNLTKLGSLGLTGSVGFSIPNAIKGYNEKLNQMLAWSSDNPFVKSLPPDIQDKYFAKGAIKGFAQGTKLQATTAYHKYANTVNVKHMGDMQLASMIFAQELIDNNGKIVGALKAVKGLSKGAEREYQKLVYMYEQGGISSRVEELINSSKELKLRFATGPRVAKWSGRAGKALETAASVTMSQELVSSLMMFDLLTQTLGMPPEKAVEANLHFMNFNKRGTWKIMDYIRRYTMFGNAIAQGAKAFQNAWIEQTNDPNQKLFGWFGPVGYTISDRAIGRAIRNVIIGMGMNLAARMWAENICGGSHKDLGSPFDSLNPYELMRDIPIAYDCDENGPVYFRFPVEYGTGNVENAAGVSVVQVLTGAWSAKQALEFVADSLRDNALPISMPVMKTKDPFQLAVSFLMPLVPEPAKGAVLAFGGIDSFGNPLNSVTYHLRDYKPSTGKATTDKAWSELAESLYGVGIFGNLSPEQAKVLTTSWTQGVFREMLTHAVEDDPKGSLWGAILGVKSVVRESKGYDKIAYTMAQTYLQSRYEDLNEIAIKAEGTGNPHPSTKWLEENGYEMDETETKLLNQVLKYRASLRDKSASQERRYKNNVNFIKSMRAIEGYNDN